MKIRTIVIAVAALVAVLAGLHFALNTDWMELFKSMHARPPH